MARGNCLLQNHATDMHILEVGGLMTHVATRLVQNRNC